MTTLTRTSQIPPLDVAQALVPAMPRPVSTPIQADATSAGAESELEQPRDGVALCLSGGGYRAMLFHLGAIWRLNELGQLPLLDRITSVSGGSIIAGALALAWPKLNFDAAGVARAFDAELAAPVRRMAAVTIDAPSIVKGLLGFGAISDRVIAYYRRHLYGTATLQDLPERPRFVIHATNLQSKALWRFSREWMGDYRVGGIPHPTLDLAAAVAASSAFPPFLSPVKLKLNPADFTPGRGQDLQRAPFTANVLLADGGVYDNMGLETAWKTCRTVLVSDGGIAAAVEERPARDWARHTYRILSLIDNQVRALRKRQVVGSFVDGRRLGAYWGIGTNIANYGLTDSLPFPAETSLRLAATPTRLAALKPELQQQLINWGYAVCDAALRAHLNPRFPKPPKLPY
jgi:NTE family protein